MNSLKQNQILWGHMASKLANAFIGYDRGRLVSFHVCYDNLIQLAYKLPTRYQRKHLRNSVIGIVSG